MDDEDFAQPGNPDFFSQNGSKPPHINYIGEDKPVIKRVYEPKNRREWPSKDYDARFDEDLEDIDLRREG